MNNMNNKKRIAFVICSMEGGGAQRVITILSRFFAQKGYIVSIIATSTEQLDYVLDPKVRFICISTKSRLTGLKQIERFCRLYKELKKENNDCVIAFLATSAIYVGACKLLGIKGKFIVSERMDPNQDPSSKILRKLRDFAYSQANWLVCQTEDAKKSFSKHIQEMSVIIQNPINDNLPKPHFGVREKRIVTAARLDKQKNVKMLVNAFSIFHKMSSDYILEIYGKGDLESDIANQIKTLGLEKSVFLKGFVSDIYKEMQKAAFFVLSSDYEGISNSMLEALCLGLPVVSTDHPIGGARMYIKNDWNGYLSPVGDAEKFAHNMIKMVQNHSNDIQMQINASAVKNQLTTSAICQEWEKLIEE